MEFTSKDMDDLVKKVETSVSDILKANRPISSVVQQFIKKYTPKETRNLILNSEQVTVSTLEDNNVLITFKSITGVNAFIYSLTKKKSKWADLFYAIKCLFT